MGFEPINKPVKKPESKPVEMNYQQYRAKVIENQRKRTDAITSGRINPRSDLGLK